MTDLNQLRYYFGTGNSIPTAPEGWTFKQIPYGWTVATDAAGKPHFLALYKGRLTAFPNENGLSNHRKPINLG